MGAWGVLAYDNDDANDWAYGLDEVSDLSLVESAFAEVENSTDYLEGPEGSNALAACEVLARLQGNAGYNNSYTEKVDLWVAKHPCKPSAELLSRANSVIERVLSKDSELRALWEDSENTEWLASVADLRRRMLT